MVKEDAKLAEDLCKYERISFIEFDEDNYNYFVKKCMLNDEMSKILKMLIHGCSIVEIANKVNLSEPTLNRRIKLLKKKIKKVL